MTEPGPRLASGLDRLWFSAPGRAARRAARQTADVLLPTWCVGCGAAGDDLCGECSWDFRLLTRSPFRAEGPADALPITDVDAAGVQVLPVFSAGCYKTMVADVVVAFKDHERIGLVRVLAPSLSRSLNAAARTLLRSDDAVLIWPPSSSRAMLRRGRSPVKELIDAALLPDGVTPLPQTLRRDSGNLPSLPLLLSTKGAGQKGRSKGGRRAAVAQFTVEADMKRFLHGREVLLIDDVLTTGATLHGMYAALTEAGGDVRGAAVMAVTPRAGHEVDRTGEESNFG